MEESKLILGDTVIWENPSDLGHFGIKLRKQVREDEIIDRLVARAKMETSEL